jgi:Dolichyl-phosphate-mannose-protein mannosyltransferase
VDLVEKAIRVALLLAVLVLASYLRITGLDWGLTSGYGSTRNFHPDEFYSLRGVLQIDLLKGRLEAPAAYFEGTFNYYLWAVPKAALKLLGKSEALSDASRYGENHGDLLYLCRSMSVFFDVCTVIVVFLAIKEGTHEFYPSLLGTLCYAALPMQVIYAHFMRPHVLSNLLCSLVIWLSLKVQSRPTWWMLLGAGFISGLGAATRYPVAIIAVIPCLYLLLACGMDSDGREKRLLDRVKAFVSRSLWLIVVGFAAGLFIGHPELFLDSRRVIAAITRETMKYASSQEFNANKLLNLSLVWQYITYVIPFAMYPFLWLPSYCAILYLVFRRKLYSRSLPILIFSALYLYCIAKGYLGQAIFARTTLLLFPGFCILVGLAYGDLLRLLKKQRMSAILLTIVTVLVIAPSVVFDVAYAHAMDQKDVRSALREDLNRMIANSPATIAVSRFGPWFYTVMPAVEPLKSKSVTVQPQEADQPADFFLVGFTGPIDPTQIEAMIRRIEQQGNFKYERTYNVRPKILEQQFQLARFPPDMTYPFPTILLFRAKTEA